MQGLLDSIRATFSRELVRHVAARLGEGESGIGKALGGIVPMVLCGLINKAASCPPEEVFTLSERAYQLANGRVGSMTGVLGMLGSGTYSGSALGQGELLLSTLFGTAESRVAAPVSSYAGIRLESATVLLHMVGAVLPAMLGQYAAYHRLNALGFSATLLSLKNQARALLPPGLSGLTGLVWLGGLGATAPRSLVGTLVLPVRQPASQLVDAGRMAHLRLIAAIGIGVLVVLGVLGVLVANIDNQSDTSVWYRATVAEPRAVSSEIDFITY